MRTYRVYIWEVTNRVYTWEGTNGVYIQEVKDTRTIGSNDQTYLWYELIS